MESFQSNGDWWVPNAPEEKVSGEISFTPADGIKLGLNGYLPDEEQESKKDSRGELSKRYPILYGDTARDGPVTVQNAIIKSTSFGGYSGSEEYLANRLFVGAHLCQNPSFIRADFFIDEIPDWTGDSIVKPVIDRESIEQITDEDVEAAYVATDSKEYIAKFEDLKVKIVNSSNISSSMGSMKMETLGVLRVVADDRVSLNTLFDYRNYGLEYLSFAVGAGIHPDRIQLYTELESQPIDVYYMLPNHAENKPSIKTNHLFHIEDIDFETSFRSWIKHSEKAPEVHQNYGLLIYLSNLPPQLQFLVTVVALEAYYDAENQNETYVSEKEFDDIKSEIMDSVPNDTDLHGQIHGLLDNVANYPSIKDKLLTLIESEEDLFDTFFEISELTTEARNHRNSVAHGSSEATATELYVLSRKLQLVLEGLIARKIGVPKGVLVNSLLSRHQEITDQLDLDGPMSEE